MNTYSIEVWYRYTINGEQEKDFEIYKISAESEEKATEIALSNFKSHTAIPFKTRIL